MREKLTLLVNGQTQVVDVDPDTPLLYVLRNDLGLKGPKFGCGSEQCNTCKVLVDGTDVPSCELPVSRVLGMAVTTIEGLGSADELHPLQEAFLEEQAAQCGYCTAGMIIAAQGLLNRSRYPSDEEIRAALAENLCRCGTYDRVRRAIKLRIGRSSWDTIYEVQTAEPLQPLSSGDELPASIRQTPDLDAWIRVDAAETITIFSGKVELGQGIKTALAQIAAEELDVDVARILVVTADTQQTPDEGMTTGSMSIEVSGAALRVAAAEARQVLLTIAHEELESASPVGELTILDGTIRDPQTGQQTSYWALMGGKRFGHQISGSARPKTYDTHQIVGQAVKRVDLLNKVTGIASYVHDLELPDMLHARVVRPPNYDSRLLAIDEVAARQLDGIIDIVRDGSFLGVIAEREEYAVRAMQLLRENITWQHAPAFSASQVYEHLLNEPGESALLRDGVPVEAPVPPIETPGNATETLSATYKRPYQMHASLGPSAAAAQFADGQLTVWTHSQGVFNLQVTIAQVLDMPPEQIRVIHVEGAGCYGHNGADDAALDAVLLARAVPGRPVLLKWMRDDEHGWEPYGSAMVMKMKASLKADGKVAAWNHDVWSYTHSTRPRGGVQGSGLLAAWHLAEPRRAPQPRFVKGAQFGGHRNAEPLYDFPNQRVARHFVPNSPLRVSALRTLGAYANVFAIESFIDELAFAAGVDPVAFRLNHLTDERAKAVIEAAVAKAGWEPRVEPSGKGRGFAFARYKNAQCYVAVVIDAQVNRDSGAIRVERAVIAADAGQTVNPDGLSNQLEGGLVQALSWTLHEQVTSDETGITSRDWDTYPILRFDEAPVIETIIVNRPDQPSLGSGEASHTPSPAALANAVFDAVGLRLREIPFTPERVKKALDSIYP